MVGVERRLLRGDDGLDRHACLLRADVQLRDRRHDVHLPLTALGLAGDDDGILRVKRAELFRNVRVVCVVVFIPPGHAQPLELAHLTPAGVRLERADALRHDRCEPLGQRGEVYFLAQLEIHQLTHAPDADGQRQQDGDECVGIEALGIFQRAVGAQKHALHRAHEVEVRDIDRAASLFKAQSQLFRHRTCPLPS